VDGSSGGAGLAGELAERIRRLLSQGASVLEVVAEINVFYEEHGLGRLIVVGGYAVELYTGSAYRTGDVDLVVEGDAGVLREALGMLEEWRGRVWYLRGFRYAVDIVSTSYSGGKEPVRLRLDNRWVYVEPPEDSILSSLRACVYWESHLDCERAAMVMAAQWPRIDWQYLESAAAREGLSEKLAEIRETVRGVLEEAGGGG